MPLNLAVGERDTSTDQLKEQPPSRFWRDDGERLKANRQDRLKVLRRAWRTVGVDASLTFMPGADHADGHLPAIQRAIEHFRTHLPPAA